MKIFHFLLFLTFSITTHAQQVGSDKDTHGCIPSAGYTWSKARKECIRLFEEGIRVESADSTHQTAFIVFSPDSTLAELFFPDQKESELLYKCAINGQYIWNAENNEPPSVYLRKGRWTISKKGKIIYFQKQKNANPTNHSCKKTVTYKKQL